MSESAKDSENKDQEAKQEIQKSTDKQSLKPKRKRRCSKNDDTPRTYECGCGRGYYSYPALYTHLKLKHSGQPPEGTKIPFDKHYGNRGRPREKQVEENIVEEDIPEEDEEQQAYHSDEKEDNLAQLQE